MWGAKVWGAKVDNFVRKFKALEPLFGKEETLKLLKSTNEEDIEFVAALVRSVDKLALNWDGSEVEDSVDLEDPVVDKSLLDPLSDDTLEELQRIKKGGD